jgi:hypothetical protein
MYSKTWVSKNALPALMKIFSTDGAGVRGEVRAALGDGKQLREG